jgi:mono/diheme cytochrome c family protein/plastocyanin
MNTSKQINIMVALVFIAVLATGAYTMWDPSRQSDARADTLNKTIEHGAFLFSQNCIVCHGDAGEGGAVGNRLKVAPALNRPDLQGIDPKTGQVSATDKTTAFNFVVNTITCGRIGKAMPTWGQSQGGTLNPLQIQQLATMITEGTGWPIVQEFARYGDEAYHYTGYASAGLKLTQPLDATSTTVYLSSVALVGKGSRIEVVDDPNADPVKAELMLISDTPDAKANSVVVERGVGTTKGEVHAAGSAVWLPPVPPDPAPVTQPACGQNLPAVVPTPSGPVAPSTAFTVIAQGTAFDLTQLLGVAGQPLTVSYENKDNGIAHNIHFFKGTDATGDSVAQTDIAPGPATQTLTLDPLDAGDYYYQCDVHPGQMEGTLTVVPAGAGAPAAAGAAAAPTTAAAAADTTPAADATPAAGVTPTAEATP